MNHRFPHFWSSAQDVEDDEAAPSGAPLTSQLQPMVDETLKQAANAIATHPRAALALAATVGVLAGWLIKRK